MWGRGSTLGSLSFRILCPPPFAAGEPLYGVRGSIRWRFLNGWLGIAVFGMNEIVSGVFSSSFGCGEVFSGSDA